RPVGVALEHVDGAAIGGVPDADRRVLTGARDQLAVRREYSREDAARVAFQRADRSSGLRVPHPYRAVVAGRHEHPAVGREAYGTNVVIVVAGDYPFLAAGGGVPYADRAVEANRNEL